MPQHKTGVQAASTQRKRPSTLRHALTAALVIALLAIAGAPIGAAAPPAAASTAKPKAVIIVGPTGSSTSALLSYGNNLANQAAAAGMDVRRVFHPKATAERLLANIQGAKYVVYLGHGNGWPSPYAPFQERTKNGFGLNPFEGAGANNHKYYGANWIRNNVKLGKHAVVMLVGACYAPGNGESGMPIPSVDVARQRVDNFAAGFLYAGAGVVYAFGWQQRADYAGLLMKTNQTFDQIFMTRSNGSPSGFIGWRDRYFASQRTPGARNHLDPHSSSGYYRAASGWLDVTANQWRGTGGSGAGDNVSFGPDTTPPSIPANFTAVAGNGLEVKLSWVASTDDRPGTISYRVIRNGTRIATTTATSFTHKPASAGTYRYKVRAVDAAGNLSAFTPEIAVTVSTSSSAAATVGPSVPSGLATEALGYRRIKLTWNASTSSNSGTIRYRIFRNDRRIATVTSLQFVDRPKKAGTHRYRIRAIDAVGYKSAFTAYVTGQAIKGPI